MEWWICHLSGFRTLVNVGACTALAIGCSGGEGHSHGASTSQVLASDSTRQVVGRFASHDDLNRIVEEGKWIVGTGPCGLWAIHLSGLITVEDAELRMVSSIAWSGSQPSIFVDGTELVHADQARSVEIIENAADGIVFDLSIHPKPGLTWKDVSTNGDVDVSGDEVFRW